MNKKEVLEFILGKPEEKTSFLGYKFYIWNISHRKAINLLLKNGFIRSRNPNYIEFKDIVIRNKPSQYKNYFIVEI